jgi:PII-like signaling protein
VEKKMISLVIRIKRNDVLDGKKLHELIITLLLENNISGCTSWEGVEGFGKRRRSTISKEGVTINMPLVIEVIDERLNIEPLLPEIKRIIGNNGIITLHEVDAI